MQTLAQNGPANRDPRIPVSIRIPKSIDRAIEIAAAHRDCSKQQVIEEALRAYLGSAA
jgi:predicted transcriptional regulator